VKFVEWEELFQTLIRRYLLFLLDLLFVVNFEVSVRIFNNFLVFQQKVAHFVSLIKKFLVFSFQEGVFLVFV